MPGCPSAPAPLPPNTTSDPSNSGADYIGTAACATCHPNFAASFASHGHSQILKDNSGVPPTYPPAAPLAGIMGPPPGMLWSDVPFVIGGYAKAAAFLDNDGFLLNAAATSDPLIYHVSFPANGTPPGYDVSAPAELAKTGYDFSCFRCHTTGPAPVTANGGLRQENRQGIGGTWAEAGVQCEACHGPGSNHVPNPAAGNIFLLGIDDVCIRCHAGFDGDPTNIEAADGFIVGNQQVSELSVSPHTGFSCNVCHNPHASAEFDPQNGIRNDCLACHPDQNMAMHEGRVLAVGDYVEPLTCRSCHMTLAARYANSASATFTNNNGGMIGDTHNHIFRIDPSNRDFTTFLTADGSHVAVDSNGRAALTLDYVCLRCHNGRGSAFPLTLPGASAIATGIHSQPGS